MLEQFVNVRIISAGYRVSCKRETVRKRKYHALFYKEQGRTFYRTKDKEFYLDTDCVIYLPKDGDYYYEDCGELKGRIFFVTFDCETVDTIGAHPFVLNDPSQIRKLFVRIYRKFRFEGKAGKLEAYSSFYKLLSALERNMEYSKEQTVNTGRIEPAVMYLQEHLFDSGLRVSELHKMCNISAPSFRKLFQARFKLSPKKYVLHQRLQEAKYILQNREFDSIAHVANAVGFDDQLYFSKCFKSFYGVPPSSYKAL